MSFSLPLTTEIPDETDRIDTIPLGELPNRVFDRIFLAIAYYSAERSPDPSTTNGAVLLTKQGRLIVGCNRPPRDVQFDLERIECDRDYKLAVVEHAERSVIHKAARLGYSARGGTLYAPWAACADCGRAIVGAGIARVVVHKDIMDKTPERWRASIQSALDMMQSAGIDVVAYDGPITPQVKFDGKFWTP